MTIRNAVASDIDAIVEMSSKFYATTDYRKTADMCADTVGKLAETLIDSGIMLIAEDQGEVVGMAGLYIGPFMFNAAKKSAYEVVWWVSPDTRGSGAGKDLLLAIEPAARSKGCDSIQMLALATSPAHTGTLYERLGYAHSETAYTKVL